MHTRRVLSAVGVLFVSGLFGATACGELRVASVGDAPDGSSDDHDGLDAEADTDASDGERKRSSDASNDADSARTGCDGPCPPEVIATGLIQPTTITVDDKNVYFAVEGGVEPTVYQCPKTGCVGAPIVLGPGYAFGIVVDAARVYWGDYYSGKLFACAIGGCQNQPTAIAQNQESMRGVVSDGATLFWSVSSNGGTIMRCAPSSCSPQAVAINQGTVFGVAADQNRAVWISTDDGVARSCSATSCTTPETLGPAITDISTHAGMAYWVTSARNVVSCATTGCSNNPFTVAVSDSPMQPASDGQNVYWRDELTDAIYKCPKNGCAPGPETVATKQHAQPLGQLAFDGQYVYWTTSGGVYRKRK